MISSPAVIGVLAELANGVVSENPAVFLSHESDVDRAAAWSGARWTGRSSRRSSHPRKIRNLKRKRGVPLVLYNRVEERAPCVAALLRAGRGGAS